MATNIPVRAVLPARDTASRVVSRSYETYTRDEREQLMTENPSSFLHIIDPVFMTRKSIQWAARVKIVRDRFEEFIRKGILVREHKPCFYLYEQSGAAGIYSGLFCAASTEDYRNNAIRRHEETLARREMLFARYLDTVRFNAEPVLMMYPDNHKVAEILAEAGRQIPNFEFRTKEGNLHRLWSIGEKATVIRLQELFAAMEALYIADGHHRTASSAVMAETAKAVNRAHTGNEAYNFFMSCLLPESSIKIFPYNRLVRDLDGQTSATFISKLNETFNVDTLKGEIRRHSKHHGFCMYLGNKFYSLSLREEFRHFNTPLSSLDSQILYSRILKPLLGIKDLKKDKRLAYRFGPGLKTQVDQGGFAVGFSMAPASVSQLKAIADAGVLMPPKSTYIEPKLRSGLTIYEF
jgi:uncharacterized protein (DUF1015 family)